MSVQFPAVILHQANRDPPPDGKSSDGLSRSRNLSSAQVKIPALMRRERIGTVVRVGRFVHPRSPSVQVQAMKH